jgi:hypothetical protein
LEATLHVQTHAAQGTYLSVVKIFVLEKNMNLLFSPPLDSKPLPMSIFRNTRLSLISTWLLSAAALPAALVIKQNNTTDLSAAGSWSALPNANDIAQFTSLINTGTAATGFTLN